MKMGAILKDDVRNPFRKPLGHHTDYSTVDYNSWIESSKGRKLVAKLDNDVVLAEGTTTISV